MVTRGSSTVAETLGAAVGALRAEDLPLAMRAMADNLILDVIGLCIAARGTDYVEAASAGIDGDGSCTVIGHARPRGTAGAALINGVAAHGEDFDDTFEGGPVHAGAVIVPAVFAAAERFGLDGHAALLGIGVGVETICRLSLVAPRLVHKAGFHPTSVFGTLAAAAGVGAAMKLEGGQLVDALGIAGSMASGIIEYLAEGAWTKRMHAGWSAQGSPLEGDEIPAQWVERARYRTLDAVEQIRGGIIVPMPISRTALTSRRVRRNRQS